MPVGFRGGKGRFVSHFTRYAQNATTLAEAPQKAGTSPGATLPKNVGFNGYLSARLNLCNRGGKQAAWLLVSLAKNAKKNTR